MKAIFLPAWLQCRASGGIPRKVSWCKRSHGLHQPSRLSQARPTAGHRPPQRTKPEHLDPFRTQPAPQVCRIKPVLARAVSRPLFLQQHLCLLAWLYLHLTAKPYLSEYLLQVTVKGMASKLLHQSLDKKRTFFGASPGDSI